LNNSSWLIGKTVWSDRLLGADGAVEEAAAGPAGARLRDNPDEMLRGVPGTGDLLAV
jgi:hypothetical protein